MCNNSTTISSKIVIIVAGVLMIIFGIPFLIHFWVVGSVFSDSNYSDYKAIFYGIGWAVGILTILVGISGIIQGAINKNKWLRWYTWLMTLTLTFTILSFIWWVMGFIQYFITLSPILYGWGYVSYPSTSSKQIYYDWKT